MKIKKILLILNIFFLLNVFVFNHAFAQSKRAETSVYTIDFVKAKENEYENYLEFLKLNWAKARKIALRKKYIKSYQLFILPKNEENDWHFILLTEYGTKKQYDQMEKHFGEIFKKEGVKLINGKSSRDMADIIVSKDFTSPTWGNFP